MNYDRAREDEVVTIDINQLNEKAGAGSYEITWFRDEEALTEASGTDYMLQQDDVGSFVGAEVLYHDENGELKEAQYYITELEVKN